MKAPSRINGDGTEGKGDSDILKMCALKERQLGIPVYQRSTLTHLDCPQTNASPQIQYPLRMPLNGG
jgi:hypothetical protein